MRDSSQFAELEIGVHRHGEVYRGDVDRGETYQVELRFTDPSSQAEIPTVRGTASFDLDELSQLHLDLDAYAETLTGALFRDDLTRNFYRQVQSAVQAAELCLRLRFLIGRGAHELQSLRWELLRDPDAKTPFATSEKTLVSRFMQSSDWRPIRLRPKTDLRALVAVAASNDLAKYKLAEVDLEGEVERARSTLQGISVAVAGKDSPLTLECLIDGLRDGVDILYLVCHGAIQRSTGEPFLFLQDEVGATQRVAGRDLAERIAELTQPPRLVVLASCESAGTEDVSEASGRATAQSSLAPRLAEAGVSAVLAMQGKISMQTVEKAMPVFFTELLVDGQIDRAMAVARGSVRQRPDSWMPALYVRLKGGRIWYEPGFSGVDDTFKKWKSITHSVRQGSFVPIIGPEVGANSRGSHWQQAEQLAKTHGFPMARHQRTDLAKVCQYLSVRESRRFAHDEMLRELREQLLQRHSDLDEADLKNLFKTTVRQRFADPSDPLRILAELGASVYVNANTDPMLPLALAEAGVKPKVLFSHWRKTKDNHPQEPAYEGTPSPEAPIVHCAFGFLAKADSMVLTEDDFIDYLIAAADYKLMPRVVRGTLVKSSLLFLGFSLETLSFRVLYRQIMALDGSAQLDDYTHVGVQIDPSESNLDDVERAREYLQEYFGTGRDAPRVDVYWGSAADFLNELREQLDKSADDTPASPPSADEDEDDWVSF